MGTKVIQVDGRTLEVPDDATPEQIAGIVGGTAQTAEPAEKRVYEPEMVFGQAVKNLGPAAKGKAEGLWHAATHPLDTLGGLASLVATPITGLNYGILSGLEDLGIYPKGSARKWRDTTMGPALDFSNDMLDKYGGMFGGKGDWDFTPKEWAQNIGRTFAEKPLDPLFDIAGLTPQGRAVIPKAGEGAAWGAGKTGTFLGKTLPLSAIDLFIQSHEGIGPGAIKDVFQAGKEGKSAVRETISKGIDYQDVLNRIHDAVTNLGQKRSDTYNATMKTVKGADVPVDFSKVDKAIADANEQWFYRGKSGTAPPVDKRSPTEIMAHDAINEKINKWKQLDPNEFHTVYGFDQMKQELNKFVDTLADNDAMKTPAQAYANKVMGAMRDTIREKAHPDYAKGMEEYGRQSDQLRDFKKEFKLRDTNTDIQTLKSLQQIHRRTAQVAHGEKERLLRDALAESGDTDLMQHLAAGQFNPKLPTGWRGATVPIVTSGIAGGALSPWLLPGMIATSPRLTGIAGYNAGRVADKVERAAQSLRSGLPGAGQLAGEMAAPIAKEVTSPLAIEMNDPNRRSGGMAEGGSTDSLFDNLLTTGIPTDSDSFSKIAQIKALLGKGAGRGTTPGVPTGLPQIMGLPPMAGLPAAFDSSGGGGGTGMREPQPLPARFMNSTAPTLEPEKGFDFAANMEKIRKANEKKPDDQKTKSILERLEEIARRTAAAGNAPPDPATTGGATGNQTSSTPAIPAKKYLTPLEAPEGSNEQVPDMPGVPSGYFANAASSESGNRLHIINDTPGVGPDGKPIPPTFAMGKYQFLPTTLADLKKVNPDLKVDNNWKTDEAQQDAWMRAYTQRSLEALKPIIGDRMPTKAELHAMHYFGQAGGAHVLQNRGKTLGELLPDRVFQSNPSLNRNQTAADYLDAIAKAWG